MPHSMVCRYVSGNTRDAHCSEGCRNSSQASNFKFLYTCAADPPGNASTEGEQLVDGDMAIVGGSAKSPMPIARESGHGE